MKPQKDVKKYETRIVLQSLKIQQEICNICIMKHVFPGRLEIPASI